MARVLWDLDELVEATGGEPTARPVEPLRGVSIDSRTIGAGDIFFAIKGDRFDGHDFAAAALEAGGALSVVSRVGDAMRDAGPLLIVDEPLRAMERLGQAARARSRAKVVAITGSVGKTSTKQALTLALQANGETHASSASFNNHWGVPLTLARMPRDATYAVFEIGMSHAGEITPLTRMVRPHIAIVTAIAESHLGHFDSLDDIATAKAEIFLGVEKGGVAVINRDSPYFERLAADARAAGIGRIVGFGEHAEADVRLERQVLHPDCSCVTADVEGEALTFRLGVPGEHMVRNALAVLAAAKLAGADLARAGLALSALQPAAGRGVRHVLGGGSHSLTLIDESYNANPASMRAALALLAQSRPGRGGRRIAVLGDMLELGDESAKLHGELTGPIDDASVDKVFACGPEMAHLWKALPRERRAAYAKTSATLTDHVLQDLRGGDVVMVKGSLGSRMGPVVEAVKSHFERRSSDT